MKGGRDGERGEIGMDKDGDGGREGGALKPTRPDIKPGKI